MEKVFLARIREKREAELRINSLTVIFNLVQTAVSYLLPSIPMVSIPHHKFMIGYLLKQLVSFGIYATVMEQPLTTSVLFTSIRFDFPEELL